ncbi:Transposon Ty3-I Gag-Pol polyprotein [Labeo rohita]|uniref:ribonuclease H n=1 Tax=Labeo rohita TaxID=84645 RepID=A0ABQ8LRK5_LABRO|nr:Transposon Ty3-I Gag-Pol polyprotein [Labeo rohita]
MKTSLHPSDDARDLVSFGAAKDDLDDDDDAMSTAASGLGDWSACLESEASTVSQPRTGWTCGICSRAARLPPPQRPAPFFPEVHEEISRSWRSPYSARAQAAGSRMLSSVDGADRWGYTKPPPVEEAVAAHLCPSAPFKKARKTAAYYSHGSEGGPGASREAKSKAVLLPKEDGTTPFQCGTRSTAAFLTAVPKSSFPPHDGSQSRVISRVPSSDGALQGASPTRSLSLSTSVSPAHAGGPVGAEGFNDAPQVVSGSPSSGDEPSRTNHGALQSHYLDAWHALPGVSEWVLNTVSSGYTLHFARRPPRFSGVMVSDVQERDAPVLRAEIRSLLAKQAIEVVPPENMECGLYSRYFLVPKKDGGLHPILDLRPLNRPLAKREFKMITVKQILVHIQPGDWFISVDLKDAYFHIQIAPRHMCFLRFAFEGRAYQFKVLPFGLALAQRTFTKCINAALSPLRQSGIRILNYLDDWLVIAQSRDTLENHKCQLLEHLKCLGLTINVQKSKLRPIQNITFLGMDLDSRSMRARLSQERMQSLISSLTSFKPGRVVLLKCFQRLLGRMAAAAVVCQLWLLHMRPLQLWLKSRVPSNAWKNGHLRVLVTRECMQMLAPWFNTRMFEQGVSMGRVVSKKIVTTDASLMGWGALCKGRPAYGTWTRAQVKWHINCLELKAVFLALQGFLPLIKDRHVLVRTDNTTVVSYINHQGGIRSRSLQRLAERFLLWADRNFLSIRAVHVPGSQTCGVDMLSRGGPVHGQWRLHPQTIQMIWSLFGEAEIDLFASEENAHCQLFFSLTNAPLQGDALSSRWPKKRKYAFPPVKIMPLMLQKIREEKGTVLLVAPSWPNQLWFPELAPPWPIPLRRDLLSQVKRSVWHPRPELWNLHVWQVSAEGRR